LQNDPQWAEWSIGQLRAQAQRHELVINPVLYAELSLSFSTFEALATGAEPHRRRRSRWPEIPPHVREGPCRRVRLPAER
jgi:hypothetical protein